MGSGVPGGTHPNLKNMGSGGFRVPGKLGRSGFRWVPVGSGFQANWAEVGSDGFRVPGSDQKFFLCRPLVETSQFGLNW